MIEELKLRFKYIIWYLFDEHAAITEWVGNVLTYFSAIIVATWPDLAPHLGLSPDRHAWWCFLFYFLGNIIWMCSGLYMKNSRLVWLNVFFIAINTYAMLIRS